MSKHLLEVLARSGVQPAGSGPTRGPADGPSHSGTRAPTLSKLVLPALAFFAGGLLGYLFGSRGSAAVEAGASGAERTDDSPAAAAPGAGGASAQVAAPSGRPAIEPAAGSAPGSGSSAAPGSTPVAAAAARVEFPTDAAFNNPTNVWTVVAVTYKNTADTMVMALDTARWFHGQGLPVVSPRVSGNLICLCVGAAATSGELTHLVGRVREQVGRNGKQEFKSAYQDKINNVVKR